MEIRNQTSLTFKHPINYMTRTTILIDGAFLQRRHQILLPDRQEINPHYLCKDFYTYALRHLDRGEQLQKIFYYDTPPAAHTVTHPITGDEIDLSKTAASERKAELHRELKQQRKMVIRIAPENPHQNWNFTRRAFDSLLDGEAGLDELETSDVVLPQGRKGVDTMMAVDITFLSLRQFADKIILISSNDGLVDAAKMARREGLDFVLDPVRSDVAESFLEHIDGLQSRHLGPGQPKKSPDTELDSSPSREVFPERA